MKRFCEEESGQVIVFAAMSMMVLLGFLAFATDVGILLNVKRQVQTAADCAAVAGAAELKFAGTDGYASTLAAAQGAAQTAASQNGFTNGSNGATVTVNWPTSGPYVSRTDHVEVIVQQSAPTIFMRLFGNNSQTVSARAVAGYAGGRACIYTLQTTGTGFGVNGNASLNAPGCSIYDDSTSNTALTTSGSNSFLTAKSINVVGNYSGSNISPLPTTNSAPAADPLAYLPEPTKGTCSPNPNISKTTSLSSGCYNGLKITGGTVNLGAGTYYINGDLSISGGGTITGTGVTFFVSGTTSISGSGTLSLTAPTSGTYDGILIFQSRTDNHPMTFSGSAVSGLQGIIYAPASKLSFSGSNSGDVYLSLVVDAVTFGGSSTLEDYALVNGNSPLVKTMLEE